MLRMGGKKLANWAQATGNGQKWHLRRAAHPKSRQFGNEGGRDEKYMDLVEENLYYINYIVVIISSDVDLIDTHIEQRRVNQFRDWENKVGGWCKSGEDTKLATLPGVNMQVGLAITCHTAG